MRLHYKSRNVELFLEIETATYTVVICQILLAMANIWLKL